MFQLTEEEANFLVSQNVIPSNRTSKTQDRFSSRVVFAESCFVKFRVDGALRSEGALEEDY